MKKQKGCHFYINIKNLDEVVLEEEKKTGRVEHSIHALDTFFSSIEQYGKKHFSDVFNVEKVTGSRLHMYVKGDLQKAYEVVKRVSSYAYRLSLFMNTEIAKYKTLLNFKIQIGCCYGAFYDFIFNAEGVEEETSIGFAANYAAKLQGLSKIGYLSISENMYEQLEDESKGNFLLKTAPEITKYEQSCYYTIQISKLNFEEDLDETFTAVKAYANSLNLSEISFSSAIKKTNFRNLSKKDCKKVKGIPFFADVRDFTQKFDEEGINLEEMAELTQKILISMYRIVEEKGTHVQFQGDREFALYHDYGEYNCCVDAVVAGLRIIDTVKHFQVSVGVGESLGTLFLSKIGARGEKDNIVIGSTVMEADYYEDNCAQENQLVIGAEIYDVIKVKNNILAKQFQRKGSYYYTTVGYKDFKKEVEYDQLKKNNQKNNYNGAWGLV